MSTLLLATACIAAWGSRWINLREIERLEPRISAMRSLARELIVKDRNLIAVVQQQPELYDQQIWHVYLPNDSLGLHLVTRDISPNFRGDVAQNAKGPITSAPLTRGRHVIELKSQLEEDEWITQVFVDDQPVMSAREPKDWNAGGGSSGGGHYPNQIDRPLDKPVVLFWRNFRVRDRRGQTQSPTKPSNGIALWIAELSSAPESKP